MSVQNPHDRFFRESFGRIEIAQNYLEEYLPSDVLNVLDLTDLQLQDGSFIDEEMQEHQTDLLYRTSLTNGDVAHFYFLFEHKSYPEPLIAMQLLRYMVRFWERQLKEDEVLTAVIPIVIYHGERVWRVSTEFLSLIDVPDAIRPFLPNFQYHLSDFSHLSDETIRGRIWLRVCLSVLRSILNPQLHHELNDLINLMFELSSKQTGLEYMHTILYYLGRATGKVTKKDLQQALLQQGEPGEQLMGTIAEEFIQEGMQQGMQQGLQQGLQAMRQNILDVLRLRLDVSETLFQAQVNEVDNFDDLQMLVRRAATVEEIEQFKQALDALG